MNTSRFILIIALLLLPGAIMATHPKVIAHRGHWQVAGSAQNSLRSLVKADSVKCYASEFDVRMTADGVLVVNHDADINGIDIEKSESPVVLKQRLPNGEPIPTLESYLKSAASMSTRLVCELKKPDSRAMERKAVKDIVSLVEKYGLGDRTEYITFSSDGFREFIKRAPKGSGVYYLNGDYNPAQISYMGGAGIDYNIKVMKKHPEWISESHDLGLLVNVWTVDSESDMKWCIDNNVDFITTNKPELLQDLLGKTHR